MLYLLEQHLAQQQWQAADRETSQIVQALLEKSVIAALNSRNSQKPYHNLFRRKSRWLLFQIDSLWREYSGGRFGFTSQAKIWFDSGLKDSYEIFQLFQWYQFNFSLDACPGHLPTVSHLDYVENWSEDNDERSATAEFTIMGKTWDNRKIRHQKRIWFGKLLLHQFGPESHQSISAPSVNFCYTGTTAILAAPHLPAPPPEIDRGFPTKRLIFWSAFAIWIFSRFTIPDPFLCFGAVINALAIFLLLAGMIVPESVFLSGQEQTRISVFKIYGSLSFGPIILFRIIQLLFK